MITIAQCRAARGLLNWTQQDLATASGLSKTAINNFEKGHSDIKTESLKAIQGAFENSNIEFIGQDGITAKTANLKIFRGPGMMRDILDDICATLAGNGGEVLRNLSTRENSRNAEPYDLRDYRGKFQAMNIRERILSSEGSPCTPLCTESRHLLKHEITLGSAPDILIYGQKLAFILWDQSMATVITSREASDLERTRFEILWKKQDARHTKNDK